MTLSIAQLLRSILPAAVSLIATGQLVAQPAGQPTASGRAPEVQVEKDWADNRWSRTDVGPLLASNLETTGARIAKGLSIKVGENAAAAVVYDTAACAWRAGWTGGFLKYDSVRFGLMGSPKIDGTIAFAAGSSAGW